MVDLESDCVVSGPAKNWCYLQGHAKESKCCFSFILTYNRLHIQFKETKIISLSTIFLWPEPVLCWEKLQLWESEWLFTDFTKQSLTNVIWSDIHYSDAHFCFKTHFIFSVNTLLEILLSGSTINNWLERGGLFFLLPSAGTAGSSFKLQSRKRQQNRLMELTSRTCWSQNSCLTLKQRDSQQPHRSAKIHFTVKPVNCCTASEEPLPVSSSLFFLLSLLTSL